jgi:N-acetyl-alpha-D-muramate 1-phosphate uridylyltransferase
MHHAMILAAGRGERMRPLTDVTPKPLLICRGKTLIEWHLENLAAAGFHHVVINVAHLGGQIQQHLGRGERFGLHIRYSAEPPGALETAGGIATAKPWCDQHGKQSASPFLVINGDVFTDWPARNAAALAADLTRHQALAHLVLVNNPNHHPHGDFHLAASPGWVAPKTADNGLTFSGIGVYHQSMFDHLIPGTAAPLAPLLHQAIAQQKCRGTRYTGEWTDVGTPQRLDALNQSS